MSVKLAKNGTWLAQFRCRDKFGNEVHKCKRGFASAEEAQAWEDEFIDTAGGTMEMTFGDFFKVYEADLRPRLREHTWRHLLERCAVGEYDQPVAARQTGAKLNLKLEAINKLRNRVAHSERLFNPGPDGYSPMKVDADMLALLRSLSPEAHESIYGSSEKTTVERFIEDRPAPIGVKL